jgi:beta-glucosidase
MPQNDREAEQVGADPTGRIEALFSALTFEEKIGQLTMVAADDTVTGPGGVADYVDAVRAGRAGSVLNLVGADRTEALQRMAVEETRLGIPLLLCLDVLHGYRTIFPIPLGEAAAFDPALWQRTAAAAAAEAAGEGIALTFAPMLDVSRDPRWGRIAEGPGEDPWIGMRFAAAKVLGFQGGRTIDRRHLAATAKHLGGYGAVTAGRDYASVDVSDRLMQEVYLPPFRAAVEAGVTAIMPAFTDLAGVPMSANAAVLRDLVRGRWGFDGVILSDYGAIAELIRHGVAGDLAEAAALALKAGVDIDMMGRAYEQGLPAALDRGLVAEADIDRSVRRVLALKARLGLFENPYRQTPAAQPEALRNERLVLAREAACRSIVLLTNRSRRLPIGPDVRRIALIGPLADAPAEMLGPWAGAGSAADMVSVLDGLMAALPDCDVRHAPGVRIEGGDLSGMQSALDLAAAADLVVLCLGEGASMSGEASSRAELGLPGNQPALAEAVLALGKPTVAILFSGRPLTVPWLVDRADAVMAAWFPGSEGGHAVAAVLTGRWNPSGRLPVSWPVAVGQVPVFFAHRPTGRPANAQDRFTSKYLDAPVEPQFPFGHGLSYTDFVITALRLAPGELRAGDTLVVEIEVENRGEVSGEETVLLFAHDPLASSARPVLELKGVAKTTLVPGERDVVRITLPAMDLAFLGADLEPRLEPGIVELLAGPAADPRILVRSIVRIVDTPVSTSS